MNLQKRIWAETGALDRRAFDFMKKQIALEFVNRNNPESTVRGYLEHASTSTSKHLAQKAVIGLYPEDLFAKVIWSGRKPRLGSEHGAQVLEGRVRGRGRIPVAGRHERRPVPRVGFHANAPGALSED